MAKINKLALTRLALQMTIHEMDQRELLCLLADLFVGTDDAAQPRWYGNGSGTNGLEQGIYNHMTTFRRMSNLWKKIMILNENDDEKINDEKIKQEQIRLKDYVLKRLDAKGVELAEIRTEAPNE